MPLASGVRLGPYEILSPLGAGGMGEVYRGHDPRLGREVAIKVLPPAVSADPDRLRRFELEARAVAALSHPNLVVVHDVGVGEPAFIVMELVGGSSLRERLGRGPLPPAVVARIGAQIARGLAAAHAHGIVHRDLKPENVVLDAAGTAKVLDFGLARLTVADGAALPDAPTAVEATADGRVLGTPGYMAPEQVRGEAVGPTADLFALGAMLFEMLTGTPTFPGGSAVDTLHGILHDEPKWDLLPPAAAGFEPLLRRCLEKTEAARFQSAADLAWELERGATAATSAAPVRSRRALAAVAAVVAISTLVGFAAFRLGARRVPIDRGGGLSAAPAGPPVIVLMDSPLPDRVYDARTRAAGGTNADDLTDILRDLPVELHKETTSSLWHREDQVLLQQPTLVISHLSALRDSKGLTDGPIYDELLLVSFERLRLFMAYVGAKLPYTRFLVYTRGFPEENERRSWVNEVERRFPHLAGRVVLVHVPGGESASFRDAATAAMIRRQVEALLAR